MGIKLATPSKLVAIDRTRAVHEDKNQVKTRSFRVRGLVISMSSSLQVNRGVYLRCLRATLVAPRIAVFLLLLLMFCFILRQTSHLRLCCMVNDLHYFLCAGEVRDG